MGQSPLAMLLQWLPPEGVKIVLVLFLSFLIGLEREEHLRATSKHYGFGGVRTFPLIGLIGYSTALLSGNQVLPLAAGFAVIGGFLWLSYQHKLACSEEAGITSEMSGLTTYLVGALVYHEHFWVATTLCVASVLLLELKAGLEGLTKRIPPEEIFNFTKFLLLTAVILPMVPNKAFGPMQINPFKTWLVLVAVSTVSYGSYILQKLIKNRGGVLFAALLGGAYSSTVTTIALSKRAAREKRPHLFSGAILMASGVMYLRLTILVGLFNRSLMVRLALPFIAMAGLAIVIGWLWSRRPDTGVEVTEKEVAPANPLELRAAFLFALLFVAMMAATHLAVVYLGKGGVYGLAAIMGVTDVDPFIMGLTQSAGATTTLAIASIGILIAAASNNVVKGVYAYTMSDRETGKQSLAALAGLAALGLLPIIWLAR